MILHKINRERLTLIAALAVWAGIWGGWITHTAVGLTQNAFYLAEWSTFLLDVRYGGMRLAPELIRLAVALGSVAACVAAVNIRDWRLRWAARLLLIPIGLNLVPPYPDILNLWWSEGYGVRFIVAALFWVGFAGCVLIDRLNSSIQSHLMIVLSGGAVISAAWGFIQLQRPFSAHYATTILPGWGLVLFGIGLAAAITAQIWGFSQSMRGNQKGPDII
jgi:hypothetical protein